MKLKEKLNELGYNKECVNDIYRVKLSYLKVSNGFIGYEGELLNNIDLVMIKYNFSQYKVLSFVGINSKVIGDIRKLLNRELRPIKPKSYLVDRIRYARLITDKVKTVDEIVTLTGYAKQTIRGWVKDYKIYGKGIVDNAIAFKRTLIVGA